MNLIPDILAHAPELARIRRDIHAHPETGFQEKRTADIVASALESWGAEVHRYVGGTGVVGVLRSNQQGPRIGLRAELDALPMEEGTGLPHASVHPGVFHGCGHDGHTTMLLGAAHYLAASRRFAGTAVLIFQPAEEGLGGAAAMLRDGLFARFPCDEIYGLHNQPNRPFGRISVRRGAALASVNTFDITIRGKGAHGAQPHQSVDPVMAAVAIAQALQTIVSRNVDPLQPAVVSVTKIAAGSAYNVIPDTAQMGGTIRTFDEAVRAQVIQRLRALTENIATGFGAEAMVVVDEGLPSLRNSDEHAEAAIDVARTLVGPQLAAFDDAPISAGDDFALMLQAVPGAFLFVGQGPGAALHNPGYDFNDALTPIGASLLARLVETRAQAAD